MGISRQQLRGIDATKTQLEHIGFRSGQEIWIQALYNPETKLAPDWPTYLDKNRNTKFKTRIFKGKVNDDFSLWLQECEKRDGKWRPYGPRLNHPDLEAIALKGANIFTYPNKPRGGVKNTNIKRSNTLFFEIDDRSIDEQWEVIDRVSNNLGLEPSCVLFSGGKSLQTYYQLDESIPETQRLTLARMLTCVAHSDTQVVNAARAMRLAGLPRAKIVEGEIAWNQTTIELTTDEIYSPQEIETAFDDSGLFPFGLSDRRWKEYVKLRNADGDYMDALEKEFLSSQQLSSTETSELETLFSTDELKAILADAAPLMLKRIPGQGTYENYRALAVSIRNLLGDSFAEFWMSAHCGTAQDWSETLRSSTGQFNIFSLLNGLEHCSKGWKRSPLIKAKIRDYFQRIQTRKVLASINTGVGDTVFFCINGEDEQRLSKLGFSVIQVINYWSLFPKNPVGDRTPSEVIDTLVKKGMKQAVLVGQFIDDPKTHSLHIASIETARKQLAILRVDSAVLPVQSKIKSLELPAIVSARQWVIENRKAADKRQYQILMATDEGHIIQERYIDPAHYFAAPFTLSQSVCGTGKSTASHTIKTKTTGDFIKISSQNALLHEGCTVSKELDSEAAIAHHTDLGGTDYLGARPLRGAFSVASLDKLAAHQVKPSSTIDLDEVESIVKMLVSGATLGDRQASIITTISRLLQDTFQSGGRIVGGQNRLTQPTLKFLEAITGCPINFIRNAFQHIGRTITLHTGGSLGVFAQKIIEAVQKGDRIVIPCVSQIAAATIEKLLINNGLVEASELIRLDKTTKDQHNRLFVNPDLYLKQAHPKVFIYSPVMGFGINYHAQQLGFDRVMAFAHCQGVESIIQLLERDRNRMDIELYTVAMVPSERFRSIWPQDIARRMKSNATSTLKKIGLLKQLADCSEQGLVEEVQGAIARLGMIEAMNSEDSINTLILDTLAQYQAIDNYELSHLAECLTDALKAQGDIVECVQLERNPDLTEQWNMAKALAEFETAQFWAAQSLTKYRRIELNQSQPEAVGVAIADAGSSSKTYAEHVAALKYLASNKFPDCPIDDPAFILRAFIERNGEFANQVLRFFLVQHPEVAKQLDEKNLSKQFKAGLVLTSKFGNLAEFAQLHQQLGTLDVLQLDHYDNETPELVEWFERATAMRPDFERITGYSVRQQNDSLVRLFNPIAKSLGFDPERIRGRGSKGAVFNVYAMADDECRDILLRSLEKRYLANQFNFKVGQSVRFWHDSLNTWIAGVIESLPGTIEEGLAMIDIGWGVGVSCWDWHHLKSA